MPGEMTKERCPRCGAPLLSDGRNYWCSFVGGRREKACSFGIDKPVGELAMAVIRSHGRELGRGSLPPTVPVKFS